MVGFAQLRDWAPDTLEGSARAWRRIDTEFGAAAELLRARLAALPDGGPDAAARARALADSIAASARTASRLAAQLSAAAAELSAAKAELDAVVAGVEANAHLRISACGDVAVRSVAELNALYPGLDVGRLVAVSVTASDAAAAAQDRVDAVLRRASACDTAVARRLRDLLGPAQRAGGSGDWSVRFEAGAGLGPV